MNYQSSASNFGGVDNKVKSEQWMEAKLYWLKSYV